jgi:hypothetical protein
MGPLTPSVAATVLPRELQRSRSPPGALLALDTGFPQPPGPDPLPCRLERDNLWIQDAFRRLGLAHARFPARARGRLACAPCYVRAISPCALSPGTVGPTPRRRLRSPCRVTSRALGLPLGSPRRARGRRSSPTSATSFGHEHPRFARFSSGESSRLRRPRRSPTRRPELVATPARLAATRPRVGHA